MRRRNLRRTSAVVAIPVVLVFWYRVKMENLAKILIGGPPIPNPQSPIPNPFRLGVDEKARRRLALEPCAR